MAIILQRRPPKLIQRIYIWDVLKSMGVTAKRFLERLFHHLGQTTEPKVGSANRVMRNEHRLVLKNDGKPLCDGCQICAVACPSRCLAVSPPHSSFSIDYARCLLCGTCVEACPLNAIRMDGKRVRSATQKKDLTVELNQK